MDFFYKYLYKCTSITVFKMKKSDKKTHKIYAQ